MIATLATVVLLSAGVPITLALVVFCLELVAGILSRRVRLATSLVPGGRTVVLMPAHNEAKVIAETLARVCPRLADGMELVVVADNCTDETAAIVRAAGVTVLERSDPARRGKGYALAHGVAALGAGICGPVPACVIVVDADAWPEGDALARLAALALGTGRPVQGCFLIAPDRTRGPVTRVSNFAHMLKNRVRLRGVSRIAGTAFLCGSGMAFPWPVLAGTSLADGEIVEDLVLGIRLALAGHDPLFVETAQVLSASAPGDAETRAQRRRWEHGFLAAARRFVPPLVANAARTGRLASLWMALHLLVPPLIMLLAVAILFSLAALLSAVTLGTPLLLAAVPAALSGAALLLIGAAWWRDGRDYLGLADILALPRYLAAKLGIWSGLVRASPPEWNRTDR